MFKWVAHMSCLMEMLPFWSNRQTSWDDLVDDIVQEVSNIYIYSKKRSLGRLKSVARHRSYVQLGDLILFLSRFVYYKELKAYRQSQEGYLDKMMEPLRLCVGGEWHRYPSSFYIPNKSISFSFVRSDFHGQLPQPFPVRCHPGKMTIPTLFLERLDRFRTWLGLNTVCLCLGVRDALWIWRHRYRFFIGG